MKNNKKTVYSMTDEELKSLKKTLERVKKLDFFNDKQIKSKQSSNKKVA